MRTAIIDADSLVYMAARSVEEPIQWDHDLWTLHAHLDPAIDRLNNDVREIVSALDIDNVVMTLSDYENPWRKEILPTYKSNRKDVRKPVVYRPLREYVHETWTTFQRPGLEGDDVIGILLTAPEHFPGEKIAVSLDKDMKTLPGMHLNLKQAQDKGNWFPFTITEDEANYHHMLQTLTGDTVDGYKGCPGMGAVSAAKALEPFMNLTRFDCAGAWNVVVKAYEKKQLTEDDAMVQARVARICRHTDYNFKKREVILWTPPKA